MAAMLEQGFDEPSNDQPHSLSRPDRSYSPSPLQNRNVETTPLNRWEPNTSPTENGWGMGSQRDRINNGQYTEISVPLPDSGNSISSAIERTPGGSSGHAKKRSGGKGFVGHQPNGGRYGPLGPLDDNDDWGRSNGINGNNGRQNGYQNTVGQNGYSNGNGNGNGNVMNGYGSGKKRYS